MNIPESRFADLDGPVHWVDHGGAADGPTFVCVHGLGGAHVNWIALAPLLTDVGRVVALDLPGFGLTRAEGRSTTVQANATLLTRFVREVVGVPVVLVGNSMGALISIYAATELGRDVAGVVLLDPPAPPARGVRFDPLVAASFAMYTVPSLSRFVLRERARLETPREMQLDTVRLCFADPSRSQPEVFEAHVAAAEQRRPYPEMQTEYIEASRSILTLMARRGAYVGRAAAVRAPVLLVHGAKDRLVPVGTARALARRLPHWTYREHPDAGHTPQLEDPQWVADRVHEWLADVSLVAAR